VGQLLRVEEDSSDVEEGQIIVWRKLHAPDVWE